MYASIALRLAARMSSPWRQASIFRAFVESRFKVFDSRGDCVASRSQSGFAARASRMDLAIDATLTSLASEMRVPNPPARMTLSSEICPCLLDVFVCQYVYIDKASSRFYGFKPIDGANQPESNFENAFCP